MKGAAGIRHDGAFAHRLPSADHSWRGLTPGPVLGQVANDPVTPHEYASRQPVSAIRDGRSLVCATLWA